MKDKHYWQNHELCKRKRLSNLEITRLFFGLEKQESAEKTPQDSQSDEKKEREKALLQFMSLPHISDYLFNPL